MNYQNLEKKWIGLVGSVSEKSKVLFETKTPNSLVVEDVNELISVAKAIGIIGPLRLLNTILFAQKQAETLNAKNAKGAVTSLEMATKRLSSYLTYLSNGGLDRENWFHSELQVINKFIGIKQHNLHYRLDSKSLRNSLETQVVQIEENTDKRKQVKKIAKERLSEWTANLRQDPENENTKNKILSLLSAIYKTSEYPVNQNTIWVLYNFMLNVTKKSSVDNLVVINVLADVDEIVKSEIENVEIKFKSIRRTVVSALVILIENHNETPILNELIEHFELGNSIAQYELEQQTAVYPKFAESTNVLPEILKIIDRLKNDLDEGKVESKKLSLELKLLNEISGKYIPGIKADLSNGDSNTLIFNLEQLRNETVKSLSGPDQTTVASIDYIQLKQARANLYSIGKGLEERTEGLTHAITETTNLDDTFSVLYKKLIKTITTSNESQSRKLIYATAALFEWADQSIRTHSDKNAFFLRKADSMLESFPSSITDLKNTTTLEIFEIESFYINEMGTQEQLYDHFSYFIISESYNNQSLSKECRELIPNTLLKLIQNKQEKKESHEVPEDGDDVPTNPKSRTETNFQASINYGPLIDDILAKHDQISRLSTNLKRKRVSESTLLEIRSLLHTLKGTAGLTQCKRTFELFKSLESQFEEIRLNLPSPEIRVAFTNKLIHAISEYTGSANHSISSEKSNVTINVNSNALTFSDNSISGANYDLRSISEIGSSQKRQNTNLSTLIKLSDKLSNEIRIARRQLDLGNQEAIHDVLNRAELFTDEIAVQTQFAKTFGDEASRHSQSLYKRTKKQMEQSPRILHERISTVLESTLSEDQSCELIFNAGSVQLPKSSLFSIAPYLEHLVRNAVDHGIGNRFERSQLNKPEISTVKIDFFTNGPDLTILIEDDGQGFDFATLYKKMGKELPSKDSERTKKYLEFIETKGITSLKEEKETSGKGLGLHSVQQYCTQLNGRVSLVSSSVGTKVKINIPNQALGLKCLVVREKDLLIALPTDFVKEVNYMDRANGAITLRNLIGFSSEENCTASISLKLNNTKINVDEIIGVEDLTPRYSPLYNPSYVGWAKNKEGAVVQIVRPNTLLRKLTKVQGLPIYPESKRKNVLVVDDSKPMRDTIGSIIRSSGFEPITAFDGIDALKKLGAGIQVQAMIVDIDMPRMNGFHFCEKVKRQATTKSIPIVIVSGKTSSSTKREVDKLNINQFLTKPFKDTDLKDAIERVMP